MICIYPITKWLAVLLSGCADRMPQSGYIPYAVVCITFIRRAAALAAALFGKEFLEGNLVM